MALVDVMGRKLYLCDTDKNKECNKHGCGLKGGECIATFREDCAFNKYSIEEFLEPHEGFWQ